jgi:hypothetical protein
VAKHAKKKVPASVEALINDCLQHDDKLTHHYPAKLLQEALNDLPTDVAEYSACADTIQQAELADIAASRQVPNPSGDAKDASGKLKAASTLGSKPVEVGGQELVAGVVVLRGNSLLSALPTPLLLVLIALLAVGVVPLAQTTRRLVRARRSR